MLRPDSLRLDRAISLYVSHPIARSQKPSETGIPILMYHGINGQTGSRHPYFETNTSPQRFRQQLHWMASCGYQSCDLEAALKAIKTEVDPHKVVITFDDGYADFFDSAYPILLEYGFSAIMFVVSDLVGVHRYSRCGREYLTWGELREMQAKGIEVGSHTATHAELQSLTHRDLEDEVRRSKQTIEDNLGTAVESFAYPFAFPETNADCIDRLRNLLEFHGYRNGVSTIIGTANKQSDPYFLPRLPVNTFDDEKLLQAKLEGGYEWMHAVQYMKKYLQATFS